MGLWINIHTWRLPAGFSRRCNRNLVNCSILGGYSSRFPMVCSPVAYGLLVYGGCIVNGVETCWNYSGVCSTVCKLYGKTWDFASHDCLVFVIWGFPTNGGTCKWLVGKILLKWMIWRYPYFRKPPFHWHSTNAFWLVPTPILTAWWDSQQNYHEMSGMGPGGSCLMFSCLGDSSMWAPKLLCLLIHKLNCIKFDMLPSKNT